MATFTEKLKAQEASLRSIERLACKALSWLRKMEKGKLAGQQLQKSRELLGALIRHSLAAARTVGEVSQINPGFASVFPLRPQVVGVYKASLALLSSLEATPDLSVAETELAQLRKALSEFLKEKAKLEI